MPQPYHCSMIQLLKHPFPIVLQADPILFELTSTEFDRPFFRIGCEPVPGLHELLPLNQEDTVTFNLSEFFASELRTSYAEDSRILPLQSRLFTIRFYESWGSPPVRHDETSFELRVVAGKIPAWCSWDFRRLFQNFWFYLFESPFLSLFPNMEPWPLTAKRLLPNQPEPLCFIAPASMSYALHYHYVLEDGSTGQGNSTQTVSPQAGQAACLQAGPAALGLLSVHPLLKVVSYTVKISGSSAEKHYAIDHGAALRATVLVFKNSLGGYDSFAFKGASKEASQVSRISSESLFDPANPDKPGKRVTTVRHAETVELNTGLLTAFELHWLNELLISEEVLEYANNRLQPVIITSDAMDRHRKPDFPASAIISYERLSPCQV